MSDLSSLLGDDPEIQTLIRDRAASLINSIFDQAEFDLRHGDSGEALGRREPYGIWGGLSEKDRRSILRRNRQSRT